MPYRRKPENFNSYLKFFAYFCSRKEIFIMNQFLYKLLYHAARLFSRLPFRVLYILSDFVFFIAYCCIGYRRKVVQTNLRNSFPDKSKAELSEIERKFYHNLCDYFFETIKLLDMNEKEMLKHFKVENVGVIDEALNNGRNVVLYLSHTFNWEWLVSMKLFVNSKNEDVILGQIYHPLENKYFDKLFLDIRSVFGQKNIAMSDTLRALIRLKNDNKNFFIGSIADQVPIWSAIGGFVDFMHQDTAVLSGSERISRKFNAVVTYGEMIKESRGKYRCVVSKICDDTKQLPDFEITRIFFEKLQASLEKDPANWLWSHRRWKRTREGYEQFLRDKKISKQYQG